MAIKRKKKTAKKSGRAKFTPAERDRAGQSAKRAGSTGTDPKRVAAILARLDEAYPDATCELKHANAIQLLISTIL
jgi:endonuclease-3